MTYMKDYQTLPDEEAERIIYDQMTHYDESSRLTYARIGLMCVAVHKRLLWRYRVDPDDGMPCRSFARWLRLCAPFSYSTAYAALRDCEELADVPAVDLAQIPVSNFPTMKQLSTKVRAQPEVLEAAKTQKSEEFVETIRRDHPEQHLERNKPMRFNPPESAAAKIEDALRMAEEHGAANRNDALELLAITAVDSWRFELEVEQSHQESKV